MANTHDSALVLFPGALGDFVCFLPTLRALRARHAGQLRVVAQPAFADLLRLLDVTTLSIDRREIAALFADQKPIGAETPALLGGFGTAYSWTGSGNPRFIKRLQRITEGIAHVYPFRGMRAGEHATDYYARCAGLSIPPSDSVPLPDDAAWANELLHRQRVTDRPLLMVHPGSGSRRKNWTGFPELSRIWAARTNGDIIVIRGPVEAERNDTASFGTLDVRELTLVQLASLLRRATLYVGNDSGVSHLAGAVGVASLVLFGASDPRVWAPRGSAVHIMHVAHACQRCGPDVFCTHRLPPKRVAAQLEIMQKLAHRYKTATRPHLNRIAAARRPAAVGGKPLC